MNDHFTNENKGAEASQDDLGVANSNTLLIDTDDDGLDDRLNGTDIDTGDSIQEILHRLDMLRVHNLPLSTIEKMMSNVQNEQQILWRKARELEFKVNEEVVKGNFTILAKLRKQVRLLNQEYEKLEQEHQKIFNIRQESILSNRLAEQIGAKSLQYLDYFILILIIFVLGLLGFDLLVEQGEHHFFNVWTIFMIDSVCCIVFLFDFFFRLSQAEDKKWYWKHHWVDFLTSIPIPPMSDSRWIRVGRLTQLTKFFRFIRLLRVFRIVYFLWRGMDKLGDLFDVQMMKKSFTTGLVVILVGAVIMFNLEASPDTTGIQDIPLSLWWAFTTVVTGGFGDIYNPQTIPGQFITATLVIAGMILMGVFTATLTSLYVGEGTDELNKVSDDIASQLDDLRKDMLVRMEEQEKQVAELQKQLISKS